MDGLNFLAEKMMIRQAMRELAIDNSMDIEKAMTRISEKCLLLPPNDSPIKGKAAIEQQLIKDTVNPIRSMDGKTQELEVSNVGDIAWCHGSYQIEYSDSKHGSVNGHYLSLFRKEFDVWKLVAHSWSEIH